MLSLHILNVEIVGLHLVDPPLLPVIEALLPHEMEKIVVVCLHAKFVPTRY